MKSKLLIPPSLEITTQFPCLNRCSYCPQDLVISKYRGIRILTLDNFKKALENVPKNVQITYAAYSEPFLNPEAPEMMVYANELGYRQAVYTTLVGFKDEYIKKIKDIPFTWFHVHNIGQRKQDLPFVDEWIDAKPNNRANNLDFNIIDRQERLGRCSHCGLAFNANLMLPNGDCYICCSDWGLKYKIGNIFETNYNDLDRNWDRELCRYCVYHIS